MFVFNFINKTPFIFWFSFDFILWNQDYFFWKRVICMFSTVFTVHMHVFVIWKNYMTIYVVAEIFLLLLWSYYKNLDLLDQQATQFDLPLSAVFNILISCGLKLLVLSLHPKQYVVPIYFPDYIGFIFDGTFFISDIKSSISLTIHFKNLDFIKWFDMLIFLFCHLVLIIFCLIFLNCLSLNLLINVCILLASYSAS